LPTENTAARAPLVLASASPRRLDLLRQAGVTPDRVISTEIDESPRASETPRLLALRLAREKALAGAALAPGAFVLAADTVVALGRRVFGKPSDEADARRMLALLSGRAHRVLTGVAVCAPDGRVSARLSETRLQWKRLTPRELDALLAGGEWRGVAGGYRIQGLAAAFTMELQGSYTGVVGLPLYETLALLQGLGYPIR
jgi:septum formation protein